MQLQISQGGNVFHGEDQDGSSVGNTHMLALRTRAGGFGGDGLTRFITNSVGAALLRQLGRGFWFQFLFVATRTLWWRSDKFKVLKK